MVLQPDTGITETGSTKGEVPTVEQWIINRNGAQTGLVSTLHSRAWGRQGSNSRRVDRQINGTCNSSI